MARFIGRTNIVPARVLSAGEVEVEGVRIAFSSGLAAGQTVRLVVRPEMIDLQPAAAGAPDAAVITHHTFLGEKTDYQVKLGALSLQATASDHYRKPVLEIGQPVAVHFHAQGIHVLK